MITTSSIAFRVLTDPFEIHKYFSNGLKICMCLILASWNHCVFLIFEFDPFSNFDTIKSVEELGTENPV